MEYSRKERKQGGLGKMNFPMVADVSHQIAMKYDCMISEGDDNGVSLRATFIIDSKGVIRHKSLGDLPVGRNIDEVLRLVQAFQYTDKYGEVCPASWEPGASTINTKDESNVKAFWENVHGKAI